MSHDWSCREFKGVSASNGKPLAGDDTPGKYGLVEYGLVKYGLVMCSHQPFAPGSLRAVIGRITALRAAMHAGLRFMRVT